MSETKIPKLDYIKIFLVQNIRAIIIVVMFTGLVAYASTVQFPDVPSAQNNSNAVQEELELIEDDISTLQEEQDLDMSKMLQIKSAKLEDKCVTDKQLAKAKVTDYHNEQYELVNGEDINELTNISEQECLMDMGTEEKEEEKKEDSPDITFNEEANAYTPDSLYYIFLKTDSTYVSQTPKEHFANNGYLATDIATNKQYYEAYAPSWDYIDSEGNYYDEAREYTTKIVHNYGTMGLTVELHWEEDGKNYNWAIGHMKEIWIADGDKIKTGQKFGSSGGCVGDLQENEVSSGCHTHIELRLEGEAIAYPTYTSTPHGNDLEALKKYKEKMRIADREYIGEWKVSTYYTPLKDQVKYFNGTYDSDFVVNCHGDCFSTASGYRLSEKDVKKVVACPPTFDFGTVLEIEGVGEVICRDRGGAIKGKRLDLWVGSGDSGFNRIGQGSGNNLKIYILDKNVE